jgi:hypothetical protein
LVKGPLKVLLARFSFSALKRRPACTGPAMMKRLLVVQGAMSCGIFVVLLASAHFLIRIFFGPDFEDAVPTYPAPGTGDKRRDETNDEISGS